MEIETGWLRSGPRILIMISSSSAALRGLNGWLIIRASTMTVMKIVMTMMISNKAIVLFEDLAVDTKYIGPTDSFPFLPVAGLHDTIVHADDQMSRHGEVHKRRRYWDTCSRQ